MGYGATWGACAIQGMGSYGPRFKIKEGGNNNTVYNAIMNNCVKCQRVLAPGQSPLASFLYHPSFSIANSVSDFQRWEEAGFDKLGKLGSRAGLITEAQISELLGGFPNLTY